MPAQYKWEASQKGWRVRGRRCDISGESGVEAEDEQEAETGVEVEWRARGVPLTITPPPDEHQLDAEERNRAEGD